eukprot:c9104_g1_i1 orf=704-1183(+)
MTLEKKSALGRFIICSGVAIILFGLMMLTISTEELQEQVKVENKINSQRTRRQTHIGKGISSHDKRITVDLINAAEAMLSSQEKQKTKNPRREAIPGNRPKESVDLIYRRKVLNSSFGRSSSLRGSLRRLTARSNITRTDEESFHIDYSGPKTHPPKNN